MLHATIARRVLFLSVLILLIVGQAGSASAWRAVWTSDRPESAQPPQGKLSTYIQVVGQFDTVDYERDPASAFALQETIIVPVDGSSALSTTTLEIGVVYQIRASGTFFVGGPGDMLGDAEYAQFNNPPSSLQNHCGGDPNDVDLGIGINDNVIDNVKVPFWGDYEPSHVYAINFVGEGSPINLNYHDCSYVDNSGSLMVEVWRPVVNTWHIATHGSDVTGDGSEANPFATIQHGIDMASDGDTVLAHPGVYRENIVFGGKNITVGSLFVTTANGDYILQTVIDGNRNGHVVTFANGEAATARLSGFVITDGFAQGDPDTEAERGGGIYCMSSSPILTNLIIMDNEAGGEGGGMYFAHCSPAVRHVSVINNQAGDGGGGIRYSYGSVDLENVVVAHNSAPTGGSGLFLYHADGRVANALIADNTGGGKGGGLVFDGSSPTFIHTTIVGNRTSGRGGGMNISYMSQPSLVNSILWGNTPEQIYFDTGWPGQAVTVEHTDVQGGEAGIVTNGQGPVHWGQGNLDTSPRFVHADLGNYRLADNSPVIGAGRTAGAPNVDIEGNSRPNPAGSNPDMGAYENTRGLPAQGTTVFLPLVFRTTAPPELYVIRGSELRVPRSRHTATRLRDGRILLVGGEQATDVFLADVDIFDPVTGSTSQAAPLHRERAGHTATLLPDGRILVIGGYALPWQWLDDAEVYDPVADTWTVVPPLYSHGLTHTATLMRDGRVLVVGGNTGSSAFTERVEIFDPQTNSWTDTQPLAGARANQTAELLEDGRVMIAGGQTDPSGLVGGDAVLYDPQANTWTATGPMVKPRIWAQSVQLHDGRVLVAGGMALDDMPTNTFTASVEIYDPVSNAWLAARSLSQPRYAYSLERLPNGQVLAVGGARDWECCWNADSFVRTIEVYDPVANQWRTVADLPQPRAYPAATRLSDGRIWLSGGRADSTFMSDTWWLVDAQMAARLGLR